MTARDGNRNQGSDTAPPAQNPAGQQNEGEGSRTAAAEYNKGAQRTAQSGKVEQAARAAEQVIDGREGEELQRAEEEGRHHSKGEDPLLKR